MQHFLLLRVDAGQMSSHAQKLIIVLLLELIVLFWRKPTFLQDQLKPLNLSFLLDKHLCGAHHTLITYYKR